MKVLLNALQAGNRSGTGQYSAQLVRWLPHADPGLELIVFWPRDVASPDGLPENVTLRRAGGGFRRLWFDQAGCQSVARKMDADVIHFPANVGPLRHVPRLVLTVHDLSFFRNPAWFALNRSIYYRRAVAMSARRASRVIADSRATADDLMNYLDIPSKRIDVVPLGVGEEFGPASDEEIGRVREKYQLSSRFLLFLGTLEPRKNIPRIVEAWDRIAETCPDALVIAGRRGWRVESIDQACRKARHHTRIHRLDFVAQEDVAPLLSAAHAFVWPSLWEGFGLPVLEAMACGTPVLTSNVSSLPEVVQDAALTVPPEDVQALSDAILRLSSDDELRAELRGKGLRRASELTWSNTAKGTAESYRNVLTS